MIIQTILFKNMCFKEKTIFMRYIFIVLLLFLFAKNLESQILQSPDFCLVTLNNDGKVLLKWNYIDTTLINGYIIKRKIYNGIGVVEGTLNNIEVINNSTINSYIDNSTSYSTFSNPNIRSEEYRINAFFIRNDSLILSNMTSIQKTVFLTVEWDRCNKKAVLKWSKYINRDVNKYNILISTDSINFTKLSENSINDTLFNINSIELMKTFFFRIETIIDAESSCLSDTSYSNIVKLYTETPFLPDTLYIYNVTTNENLQIEINFFSSKSTFDNIYFLNRKINSEVTEISDFQPINQNVKYIYNSDVYKKYSFFLTIKNNFCDVVLGNSIEINNIVLEVTQDKSVFNLQWNSTLIFEKNIEKYKVYVKYNNIWTLISEVEGTKNYTQIALSEIFNSNIDESQINILEFKVEAIPIYNPTNEVITSFSNVVIVPLESIISVPNVFNPNSQNIENQYFTIKALFIKKYNISIFTQSGTLLFTSDDINISWNGKNKNGDLLPIDLYIYQIKYIDLNDKNNILDGVVQLFW